MHCVFTHKNISGSTGSRVQRWLYKECCHRLGSYIVTMIRKKNNRARKCRDCYFIFDSTTYFNGIFSFPSTSPTIIYTDIIGGDCIFGVLAWINFGYKDCCIVNIFPLNSFLFIQTFRKPTTTCPTYSHICLSRSKAVEWKIRKRRVLVKYFVYTRKNDVDVVDDIARYCSGTMLFNDLPPTLNNVDNSIVRACWNKIVDGWLMSNAEQHCSYRTIHGIIICIVEN